MTKNQNAFETTLTAQFGPSDLVAHVATLGTLTSPCYMVLEPTNDAQREVVYFDGIFGASSFVTTGTDNRYLPGSAASSGLTHPAGATIRSVILAQHLEDLYAYVDSLDHGALVGLTSGDDHPQYVLETDHETAGSHDAMAINAGRLQGLYATDFATDAAVVAAQADADAAQADIDAHDGSGGAAHADVVSGGADGFMTGADKAILDSLDPASLGSDIIYMKAVSDDTQVLVTATSTLVHVFTFTKPAGWNSYTLAVTAISAFSNIASNTIVESIMQIDGTPDTVGLGQQITTASDGVEATVGTTGVKAGRTTNATVGIKIRHIGAWFDPALFNTAFMCIATRTS